jgi:hypothetical protein
MLRVDEVYELRLFAEPPRPRLCLCASLCVLTEPSLIDGGLAPVPKTIVLGTRTGLHRGAPLVCFARTQKRYQD